MGRTIAAKIPARNALAGTDAMPGAIPRARMDRTPINEAGGTGR